MPELYKSAIGSLVRWALATVFGYLVAHGALTEGQATELAVTIGTGAAALLWGLWQKYRSKLKFFTALELPANATQATVRDVIANTPASENVSKAFQGTGA